MRRREETAKPLGYGILAQKGLGVDWDGSGLSADREEKVGNQTNQLYFFEIVAMVLCDS